MGHQDGTPNARRFKQHCKPLTVEARPKNKNFLGLDKEKGFVMKKLTLVFSSFVVISIAFAANICAAIPNDPRLVQISQAELQKDIAQLPLSSPMHIELLSRARSSHLAVFAYEQYKQIRDKNPNSYEANLFAGMAALNDWDYQTNPAITQSAPSPEARQILNNAQLFLSRSAQLKPTSAKADLEYGFFLWRYCFGDSKTANQGFLLIQKSVKLSPKDPTAHALLGDVCSNPFGPYATHYNPAQAAAEYQVAISQDPLYAYPHLQFVFLDLLLKRYAGAQEQMTKFLSLSPADVANEKIIKILQSAIQKQGK